MKRMGFIILALLLLPVLQGCSSGSSPKEVADNFLAAVQKADFDKASSLVESPELTSKLHKANDADGEKAAKALLGKIAFELGNEELDGDKATVEAKITSVDLGKIMASAMKDMMAMALANAFSNNQENNNTQEAVDQYLLNAINDPNAPKTTTDVKIQLVKTNDGWKIAKDNEELISALIGNIDKMFKPN